MEEFHWYQDPSWQVALSIFGLFLIYVISQIIILIKIYKNNDKESFKKHLIDKSLMMLSVLMTILSVPMCILMAAFSGCPLFVIVLGICLMSPFFTHQRYRSKTKFVLSFTPHAIFLLWLPSLFISFRPEIFGWVIILITIIAVSIYWYKDSKQ